MWFQAAELDENISFALSRKISIILLVGLHKKSRSKLWFVEIHTLQISSKRYKIQ